MILKRITVFCGSSSGTDPRYEAQAYQLGTLLASKQIGLVYGGAKVGLMGAVANGVLEHGGEVIGVLPHHLKSREVQHDGLTELILVDTMHQRKATMDELSDGVIALPGGFGTMEELLEMLTWAQLGLHLKPIALLNMQGFYDDLLVLIQKMVDQGFLKASNQRMLLVSEQMEDLVAQMENYEAPPAEGKWIQKDIL